MAIGGSVVVLGVLLGVVACCCCCCRRRTRSLQEQADEDYIKNGGALDYKEREQRKKLAERQEMRTPLMSNAQTRAQMRAKWGIGTHSDANASDD